VFISQKCRQLKTTSKAQRESARRPKFDWGDNFGG